MEQQSCGGRLEVWLQLYMHHLARCEACHRALLIVVRHAPVGYVAAIGLLQEQRIYAVPVSDVAAEGIAASGFLVDYRHERVLRLYAHGLVVVVDGVNLEYIFHVCRLFYVSAKIIIIGETWCASFTELSNLITF